MVDLSSSLVHDGDPTCLNPWIMSKLTIVALSVIMSGLSALPVPPCIAAEVPPLASASGARVDWMNVVQQAGSEGVIQVLEEQLRTMPEYELWMKRQERLSSGWNEQPFVNYVKYRHEPRQVYMSWLPGGPKAGQEILYDETKRKDAMYGHLSGLFNVASIWTSLDSSLARSNSRHSVRDAGLQSVLHILRTQLTWHARAGTLPQPERIEILSQEGRKVTAITWRAPSDTPSARHYAARTRLQLMDERPWIRQVESWDAEGKLIERIVFERVHARRFETDDFDASHSAYNF